MNHYNKLEKFGGRNFWWIITNGAFGQENFGESAGRSSVIIIFHCIYNIVKENLANCIPLPNLPKFSPPKLFPCTVTFAQNQGSLWIHLCIRMCIIIKCAYKLYCLMFLSYVHLVELIGYGYTIVTSHVWNNFPLLWCYRPASNLYN